MPPITPNPTYFSRNTLQQPYSIQTGGQTRTQTGTEPGSQTGEYPGIQRQVNPAHVNIYQSSEYFGDGKNSSQP